jgi:hypothetical protein
MIAPPNQGAQLAKLMENNVLFGMVAGESGKQLAAFGKIEPRLAIPACQFGIIAGGGGSRNPLLSGDDDLMVSIEETKLPGARDFTVVDSGHRAIVKNKQVIELTTRFLLQGHFYSESRRQPLPPPSRGPIKR